MYYVYIIQSQKDQSIYIGFADNLKGRLEEHNLGKVDSTKNKIPWRLIYYEAYLSKTDALLREKRLKYFGRALAQLKRRIRNSISKARKVRGGQNKGNW